MNPKPQRLTPPIRPCLRDSPAVFSPPKPAIQGGVLRVLFLMTISVIWRTIPCKTYFFLHFPPKITKISPPQVFHRRPILPPPLPIRLLPGRQLRTVYWQGGAGAEQGVCVWCQGRWGRAENLVFGIVSRGV